MARKKLTPKLVETLELVESYKTYGLWFFDPHKKGHIRELNTLETRGLLVFVDTLESKSVGRWKLTNEGKRQLKAWQSEQDAAFDGIPF